MSSDEAAIAVAEADLQQSCRDICTQLDSVRDMQLFSLLRHKICNLCVADCCALFLTTIDNDILCVLDLYIPDAKYSVHILLGQTSVTNAVHISPNNAAKNDTKYEHQLTRWICTLPVLPAR